MVINKSNSKNTIMAMRTAMLYKQMLCLFAVKKCENINNIYCTSYKNHKNIEYMSKIKFLYLES